MLQVLVPRITEGDDVVNAACGTDPFHLTQQKINNFLKDSRWRSECKGHSLILLLAIECNQAGLRPVFGLHVSLMEAGAYIHDREVLLPIKSNQDITYARSWFLSMSTHLLTSL